MTPGDPCGRIGFLVSGELRVHQTSRSGRDLTLYSMIPGQTCALTALSILTEQTFPAYVTSRGQAELFTVSREAFHRLYAAENVWRQFVLRMVSERIGDLLALIDGVLFTDLPTRLAELLLTHRVLDAVEMTHEQIAGEIGSSREVISRILKTWETRGVVSLGRGRVTITSPDALKRFLIR